MRLLFKLIFFLIFLSPFALVGATWFALSEQALVVNKMTLSYQDIARAKNILKTNDPRHQPNGSKHKIRISEDDLNLVTNYLLLNLADSGSHVKIYPGLIDAIGTLRIPGLPVKSYLNIELQIKEHQGQFQVYLLKLGELNIPPVLADFLLSQIITQLYKNSEYQLASNTIKQIEMQRGQLLVAYQWDSRLIKQARDTLLNQGDRKALYAYFDKLLELQAQGIGQKGSLTTLLQPLFQYAKQRSVNNDPVSENQSLLMILGAWASGHGLSYLVPDIHKYPATLRVKLDERVDFAQHFLVSAALAAKGDSALADSIGLIKEIDDSKGGSGFSFTDIAADRAGTRLGETATQSSSAARKVQKLLSRGINETDIMPKSRDLPEHMNEAEFRARFGDVGSSAYEQVMTEIERRIAACRIYRNN